MREMIAYCGLDCEQCDAYLATIHDDQELREKTAALWARLNNAPILPQHINCRGCRGGWHKDGILHQPLRHSPVRIGAGRGYLRGMPGGGPMREGGSDFRPSSRRPEEFRGIIKARAP